MANYKFENGNYYRQSSDGQWFKVNRNKDGYLTWTQPDGRAVTENAFKVPSAMFISNSPMGQQYTVGVGANGSLGHYYSFRDAANAYTRAVDRGAFSDPSENILNDLVFDAATGKLVFKAAYNGVKAAPKAAKKAWETGKKLVTGQISKETVKQGAKTAGKTAAKEASKFAGSIAGGKAVNTISEEFTGKSFGQHVAEGLTNHYGFRVSPIVGDLFNPGYYFGYGITNYAINDLARSYKAAYPQTRAIESVQPTVPTSEAAARESEGLERLLQDLNVEPSLESSTTTSVGSQSASDSELGNALRNISEDDLRAMLNRLRTESSTSSSAAEELAAPPSEIFIEGMEAAPPRPYQESMDYLLDQGWREQAGDPGVFRRGVRMIDFNNPTGYTVSYDNQLRQFNLADVADLQRYLSGSLGRPITEEKFKLLSKNPYVLEYRRTGEPFTLETLPGLNRTELVDGYDKTHMSHFPGDPVLDRNGYLVEHKVKGKSYNEVMADEFNRSPHGASIGFNSNSATSTSSTPMIWLQLRRALQNNSIARVYIPKNSPRYTLNDYGRAYQLNSRGRMVSVPGTEDHAFDLAHKPEYIGSKNVKHTSSDGTVRNVIQLPDGKYYSTSGNPVEDIAQASSAYYNRGAFYDGDTHKVMFSVDQPFLTAREFVDHLNSEYILPTLEVAGIEATPAELIERSFGPKITVPSIAGIKFKHGGTLDPIKHFRKNAKRINLYKGTK